MRVSARLRQDSQLLSNSTSRRTEKSPLQFLFRQTDRALVRQARLRRFSEASAEVRTRCVCQVIVVEITTLKDRVDQRQAGQRPIAHRYRHGAV